MNKIIKRSPQNSNVFMTNEEFFMTFERQVSELNDRAMALGFDSAYSQALYIITENIPDTTEEVTVDMAENSVRMAIKYDTTIDYAVERFNNYK